MSTDVFESGSVASLKVFVVMVNMAGESRACGDFPLVHGVFLSLEGAKASVQEGPEWQQDCTYLGPEGSGPGGIGRDVRYRDSWTKIFEEDDESEGTSEVTYLITLKTVEP